VVVVARGPVVTKRCVRGPARCIERPSKLPPGTVSALLAPFPAGSWPASKENPLTKNGGLLSPGSHPLPEKKAGMK
jgi:hypothetical protein